MSDKPPINPLFDRAYDRTREDRHPNTIADDRDIERMREFERRLPELLKAEEQKPRKDRFLPLLVIRAVAGDHGTRPVGGTFWESPDIWVAEGDPSVTPDLPPGPGGAIRAGVANTVYAHVWNLGLAPIVGIRVEFYWVDPSIGINPAGLHLIGTTSVDLAPRVSLECHRLVKCRTPWIPEFVNGGHECLFVRISSLGDPIGPNEWNPSLNRHVGQRNVSVIKNGDAMAAFIKSLEKTLPQEARVELQQVGGEEAALIIRLAGGVPADAAPVAPAAVGRRRIAVHPDVVAAPPEGRVLAELTAEGRLTAPQAAGGVLMEKGATLEDLIFHHEKLAPGTAAPLAPGVQVLRLSAFVGKTLIGGYTMVVVG